MAGKGMTGKGMIRKAMTKKAMTGKGCDRMGITVEAAYKSLNKYSEEVCGDKVEILDAESSRILILADGMGSGIKANILATMTSRILGTMFLKGVPLEKCVETLAETLPVCQVRQMAYATFSILQVFSDGSAYLAEFDNPGCIFIRDGHILPISGKARVIAGRRIHECRFSVLAGDNLVLLSDGAIHAGAGELLNFGWNWDSLAEFTKKEAARTISAMHLAAVISQACDELYQSRPGDDTTVAVMRILKKKTVKLMTGPAKNREDDRRMVDEFMAGEHIFRIICGGTSCAIVSRILDKPIDMSAAPMDLEVPPIASLEGVDLVTEGTLTLNRALSLLGQYEQDTAITEDFFKELDAPNGASMLARLLIERCTDLHLYVGTAVNSAYQNAELPFSLGVRQNLVEQLRRVMVSLGKKVTISYY